MQMVYKAWFGYFECVGYLAWYNTDHSQWMSRFDCYQLQLVYLTVEHHSVRHNQHKTLQTIFDSDQSQYLLHMLHKFFIFFAFWLYSYIFWNNKTYCAKNVVFFLPASIIKCVHRSSQFWEVFFSACWYDSCHRTI